jgi:hypothetical protein
MYSSKKIGFAYYASKEMAKNQMHSSSTKMVLNILKL